MSLYDVIKYEGIGIDWLIYKDYRESFNTKSKLIVSPGQVAILVHNGKIEAICEAGSHTLDTELLPFIGGLTKGIYSGKEPYPMEIYFVNKHLKLDFFWGTSSPIDLIDPAYGVKIRLRARGQFGVRIKDYQYFYQTLIGTLTKNDYITFEILRDFFRGFINQKITKEIAVQIIKNKITYFDIGIHIDEIQEAIQEEIKEELSKFGFEISSLSIENINCPKDDLEHLTNLLNKKAELKQLGESGYRTVRGYDVLESAAENNGNAATIMGVGMGINMGNSANNIIPPINSVEQTNRKTFTCPKCNNEIAEGTKFCPECGVKLNNFCTNCGKNIPFGSKFCPECGNKLI